MSEQKISSGYCPCCGEGLNYGDSEFEDEGVYFECSCLVCGFKGQEWYDLKFVGFSDSRTKSALEWKFYEVGADLVKKVKNG